MSTDPHSQPAPNRAAPGPSVPGDERFEKQEPVERTSPHTVLLWQYFFFPLLIVAASVGVFLTFGLIAGQAPSASELLEEMRTGGENEKDQAAQQLGILIARERMRVDADTAPGTEPPFYADPAFREGLRGALDAVLGEKDADLRTQAIVLMVGRTQDVDGLDRIERVLDSGKDSGARGPRVAPRTRKAAAMAVWYLDAPEALPLLTKMVADDDAEVRAVAQLALARLGDVEGASSGPLRGDPRVLDLLRRGLEDADGGVRLGAAVGLAVHGDASGAGFVERSLDRNALVTAGIEDEAMQRGALLNAIKGARLIGGEALRAGVERLTDSDLEQDGLVRQVAREALAAWGEAERREDG